MLHKIFKMAADSKEYWIILLFMILSKSPHVHCWDAIDLELFDIVEEVKGNFYDILGLQQVSCSKFIVELTKVSKRSHFNKLNC